MLFALGYDVYLMATQDHSQFFVLMTQAAKDIHSNLMLQIFQKQHPVTLVYCEHFDSVSDALKRNEQLNAMSPAEKAALVESANPGWKDITDSFN